MKKFKLLKELPWMGVGVIIKYKDKKITNTWSKFFENSIEFLERLLNEWWNLINWLEKIEEPKSIYKLKMWDKYYKILTDCNNIQLVEIDHPWIFTDYKKDLEVWNVFLIRW